MPDPNNPTSGMSAVANALAQQSGAGPPQGGMGALFGNSGQWIGGAPQMSQLSPAIQAAMAGNAPQPPSAAQQQAMMTAAGGAPGAGAGGGGSPGRAYLQANAPPMPAGMIQPPTGPTISPQQEAANNWDPLIRQAAQLTGDPTKDAAMLQQMRSGINQQTPAWAAAQKQLASGGQGGGT